VAPELALKAKPGARAISVKVCMGFGGVAAGAPGVLKAFREELAQKGVQAAVGTMCTADQVGCMGFCAKDVIAEVTIDGATTAYEFVEPAMVRRIVEEHILGGAPVEEWRAGPEYAMFHAKQKKVVLGACGTIDPEEIDAYRAIGGYQAAERALATMKPEEVIQEIKASGLRGRGGAGLSTGMKWELSRRSPGARKVLVCNTDEGAPGALVNRALIEGDPHAAIEGMIIGAHAIGATDGTVSIRAEYSLAVQRLRHAIAQARERGYLGKDIRGHGLEFDIQVMLGSGAFVRAEETALIPSLEGPIGEPRAEPLSRVNGGGTRTNIDSVETWAAVPKIIKNGARWFASIGSEKSKGTKIFFLLGKINNTGLVEVPMGMPLREIIYDIGGGIPGDKKLKAVQLGGPWGGCIPAEHLDVPVDHENLTALGSILGSGGMAVMDEDTCMVDTAKYFVSFCMGESCGQCAPCGEGTREMVRLLDEITQGKGTPEHLAALDERCHVLEDECLCGLGTVPNPVRSTLRYFRQEYDAHIHDKRCPAGVCKPLITYSIDSSECMGCMLCARNCPRKGITGEKKTWRGLRALSEREGKKAPAIVQAACIKCGNCFEICPFGAVKKV
jgi:NADH:ubiquinone oxidoreductase subunit F (NADH-binding)/NAD-dependent dihydropyrimidine dehydrogenase PreA subunit